MPPKRAHPSSSSTESGGKIKKAKIATKSKKVKLPKSNPPNWQTLHPEWSEDMPRGKNARLCIEKWCLLPPYDHEITEKQWKAYYNECSALDEANTYGYGIIKVEELFIGPWWLLETASQNVAAAIYGSVLDEEDKTSIARTIRGSLYFLEVEGADHGSGTRSAFAKTRLYSPFGIGISVDLAYNYHFRFREWVILNCHTTRHSALVPVANSNGIQDLDPEWPRKPRATNKGRAKIFSWTGDKTIWATTAVRINSFEPTLFGSGRLNCILLFAAGTGHLYNEDSYPTNPEVASREKFKFFEGETTGGDLSKAEEALYKELEEEEPEEDLGDVYLSEGEKAGCVPRRLLLLARQE